MIERQEVNGKQASVQYLTTKMEPTTKSKASMIRVMYDSGGSDLLKVVKEKAKKGFAEILSGRP